MNEALSAEVKDLDPGPSGAVTRSSLYRLTNTGFASRYYIAIME
jgi:hypothetical protein